MSTVPNPNDYATSDEFRAAFRAYELEAQAARDLERLTELASAGARTTRCPCGYGPFDSCPICD